MELMASSPPKEQAYGAAKARVWREKKTERPSLSVGVTMTSPSASSIACACWVLLSSMSAFSLVTVGLEVMAFSSLREAEEGVPGMVTCLLAHLPLGQSSPVNRMPSAMAVIIMNGTMKETLQAT